MKRVTVVLNLTLKYEFEIDQRVVNEWDIESDFRQSGIEANVDISNSHVGMCFNSPEQATAIAIVED